MSSFYPTLLPVIGPRLQPVQGLLYAPEGTSVFPGGERAFVKAPEPVNHYRKQILLCNSIHPVLRDGVILEADRRENSPPYVYLWSNGKGIHNLIFMVCPTISRSVQNNYRRPARSSYFNIYRHYYSLLFLLR